MLPWLTLLIILPIGAYYWSKRKRPEKKYFMAFLVLGLIIGPLSLGLYSTSYLGPAGMVTGMIGLISTMFHGAPGYQISLNIGLISPAVTVKGNSQVFVVFVNGLFWAVVYGAIGHGIDRFRNRKTTL